MRRADAGHRYEKGDSVVDLIASDLSVIQRSQLMHGAVVPRPIAWVTSQRPGGPVNLAPFSCYTYICGTPPLVLIAVGTRDGGVKDTLRNVTASGEYVINSVMPDDLAQVAASAWDFPSEASEATELGIELEESVRVKVPRVRGAVVSLECELDRLIPVMDLAEHHLMIGRVVVYRIRDDLISEGRIDVNKFLPAGRLGGPHYASLGSVIRVPVEPGAAKTPP